MNPAIRQAIARIDVLQAEKSASRGTGVLVTPDLVLTAMHVVADRNSPTLALHPGKIALAFPGHQTEAHVVDRGWNNTADWILLRCLVPPPCAPMPLADAAADGDTWETYGFPDANPRDGMVQIGTIENAGGVFEGVAAYQLFSRQAAAGTGAPVKGLSGGPVIVDGALVAVLRSSLMRDGQNVAGTLYGCPIDLILQACGELLPIPDPCRGLPGLPRQPLPAAPFRFLERFTAADAEIFFGRNREIRQVRDMIVAEGGPPVVLLYGQSGAGKSSFLDAGLLPRLLPTHNVVYLRRERGKELLAIVLDGLRTRLPARATAPVAEGAEALRLAWIEVETSAGRPMVVVLDQVDEVFTLAGVAADELPRFVEALAEAFRPGAGPRGRIVLGFRKEWFAEIQKQLELRDVDFAKVFLETLDAPSIVEIVTGLQRTRRLRDRYGLDVEPGLAEVIAGDLTADRDSAVAPTLQVLLSKMWRDATAANAHAPCFSADLYGRLNRDGVLLTDFFDQQLAALQQAAATAGGSRADVVSSGLAIDLLAYHTTPFGSAEQRTLDEASLEYPHRSDQVAWLVQELKRLYLLSDPSSDVEQTRKAARLSNDTLARAVRTRFEVSGRPGQRARRILENRAAEWSQDRVGSPLDDRDLALVQEGLAGMRRVRPDEQRLLEVSATESRRRRQSAAKRRRVTVLGVALIAVAVAVAGWFRLQEGRQREWTDLLALNATVSALLEIEPVNGLVAEIVATDRNLEMNDGTPLPETLGNLVRALGEARERMGWELDGPATAIEASSDNRIALGTNDGIVHVFRFDGTDDIPPIRAAGANTPVRSVAFSTDGEFVAAAAGRQGLGIWNRRGEPVPPEQTPNLPSGMVTAVQFAPGGHSIIAAFSSGDARLLYVCDLDTRTASVAAISTRRPVSSMATAHTSNGQLVIATAGGDLALWTPAGKLIWKPIEINEASVTAVDLTVDPRVLVAVGASDGSVTLWDASDATGRTPPLQSFRLPAAISGVKFGYQGRLLHVAGSKDSMVRTYYVSTGIEATEPLVTSGEPQSLAVSADGERLVTIGLRTAITYVQLFDLVGPQLLFPLSPPTFPGQENQANRTNALAFTGPDALVVGTAGRLIPNWRLKTEVSKAWAERTVTPLDTNQDETTAVASTASGGVVVLAGRETVRFLIGGKRIDGAAALPAPATSVGIAPDGNMAVVGCVNGAVTMWDPRSGQLLRTVQAHSAAVRALAFAATGTVFATGGDNPTVQFWAANGSRGAKVQRPHGVTALTYDRHGTLFSGDIDGAVEAIDEDGSVVMSAQLFRNASVNGLVIHPAGDTLFVAGSPGIRVFDLPSGAELGLRFPRVAQNIRAMAISANGALLAGATDAGDVLLWRADWTEWLAEACNRLKGHEVSRSSDGPPHIEDGVDVHGVDCLAAFDACTRLVWKPVERP